MYKTKEGRVLQTRTCFWYDMPCRFSERVLIFSFIFHHSGDVCAICKMSIFGLLKEAIVLIYFLSGW